MNNLSPISPSASVRFVGYREYRPTKHEIKNDFLEVGWKPIDEQTFIHAEFVVTGDTRLPEDSQVNWDTLRKLKLPVPAFPDLYRWRRENRKKVQNVLDSLTK